MAVIKDITGVLNVQTSCLFVCGGGAGGGGSEPEEEGGVNAHLLFGARGRSQSAARSGLINSQTLRQQLVK